MHSLNSNQAEKDHHQGFTPYLEKRLSQSSRAVRGIKCKCNLSWCPVCSKNGSLRRIGSWVAGWDYRHVREVVLTIDRRLDLWSDGESCLSYINKHKCISQFMRDLERYYGISVVDWVKILEWHKDGFPHWHIQVLVTKKGRAGQIGHDKIKRLWRYGGAIEKFYRSEKHWQFKMGYFCKNGYFDKGKAHQGRLPEWARAKRIAPRRISRKHCKRDLTKNPVNRERHPEKWLRYETERQLALREERLKTGDLTEADQFWLNDAEARAFFGQWDIHTLPDEVKNDCRAIAVGNWFERQNDPLTRDKTQGERLDLCGAGVTLYLGHTWHRLIGKAGLSYSDFKKLPGYYVDGQGYYVHLSLSLIKQMIDDYSYEKKVRSLLMRSQE